MKVFQREAYRKAYTEAKYILIFFVVLSGLTIFSIMDLDSEAKPNVKTTDKPELPRAPSSISKSKPETIFLSKEFFCEHSKNITPVQVATNMLLMNITLCQDLKLVSDIALENLTNGFKAQIFKIEKNNFKTDYIQLNSGLNKLRLSAILKDGQKIEESLEILSGF